MTDTDTTATRTVELGGELVTIERPSARKAARALAGVRALSKASPELVSELAAFRRRYEADNVLELDRVQAKLRNPPLALEDAEGNPRLDKAGEVLMLPSSVDRLTEADWENAGGKWRIPASPSGPEIGLAMMDKALELGEDHVYRFLALFTITNADVKRWRSSGELEDRLQDRADELLDNAFADEFLELAVAVSETVDGHFRRKAAAIGAERLGKALRSIGLSLPTPAPTLEEEEPAEESPTGPSSERPSSSTDSPAPTPDGPPTSSSTPPSTSSSSSKDESTTTTNDEPSRSTIPA